MLLNPIKRVILDTNILLDLLVFEDISTFPLLKSIHNKALEAITCPAILSEFQEVISREIFELSTQRQEELVYTAQSLHTIESVLSLELAPWRCSDPDDQIFLDLAYRIKPCLLLTKDKALLRLHKHAQPHGILIKTVLDSV